MHEFRAACRDWRTDTGAPRELAETALAHTLGGDEGAYFRSVLFEWRRELMDSWAAYLARMCSVIGHFQGRQPLFLGKLAPLWRGNHCRVGRRTTLETHSESSSLSAGIGLHLYRPTVIPESAGVSL